MFQRIIILQLFIFLSFLSSAQDTYQANYDLGKEYYKKGRYTAAMELFKPMTSEAEGNKFVQHSQYYYSLAAYKAGMHNDAYQMIRQLIYKYPDWNNIEEAYYLIAAISFEQQKARQALKYLEGRNKALQDDINQMKTFYLDKYSLDTLTAIQKTYNTDPVIAKVLFNKLATISLLNEKQQMLSNYLAQEFKFEKVKVEVNAKSQKKDVYNVAVLFPFLLNDLNLNATNRPNQYLYDMYIGMKMSADSLKKEGININLVAFDTEKSDVKIAEILNKPELKKMDLIIGPVTPANYQIVNDFGLKNNIMVVNPFSSNSSILNGNPLVYLLHPSMENIANEAAAYADSVFIKNEKVNSVIILQSASIKDSLLSEAYKQAVLAKGFKIKYHEVISKDKMKRIQDILRDSMMLTSVSHIFVSTSDQVLAANIMSAMEISGTKIPLFAGSDWLQFPLLTYDQYERRGVYFLHSDFIDYNKLQVAEFRKEFYNRMNTIPLNSHAYQGYDLMRLMGKMMGTYGNIPIAGFQTEKFIPGYVITGFNYANSQSNSYVPIVKFTDSSLRVVNFPQESEIK